MCVCMRLCVCMWVCVWAHMCIYNASNYCVFLCVFIWDQVLNMVQTKPELFTDGRLRVWSAALERVGRPCYIFDEEKGERESADKFGILWRLDFPMRCPPSIQRALTHVQPSLDSTNVCCFQKVLHFF